MIATMPRPFADRRWTAITRRENAPDASFVYGVRTTGVYCRPTCASRQPRRDNVEFFDDWRAAERAGYRACKRCQPRDAVAPDARSAAIRQACTMLAGAESAPSLDAVASAVGLSPSYFHRLFQRHVGVTPLQYAAAQRRARFQEALATGRSVTAATFAAGFGSSSRVYEKAGDLLGMTPATYRNGAAGVPIRYVVTRCDLGWLLVAASERGICQIALGDSRSSLTDQLLERFPAATLEGNDEAFNGLVARVVQLVRSPRDPIDLPLDIRGTAFQERVWQALQQIPAGTTTTYKALARRIGKPSAVRAVARACATNSLAVAIPCHRVVGSDGSLTGYRWGLQRKKLLLQKER